MYVCVCVCVCMCICESVRVYASALMCACVHPCVLWPYDPVDRLCCAVSNNDCAVSKNDLRF